MADKQKDFKDSPKPGNLTIRELVCGKRKILYSYGLPKGDKRFKTFSIDRYKIEKNQEIFLHTFKLYFLNRKDFLFWMNLFQFSEHFIYKETPRKKLSNN